MLYADSSNLDPVCSGIINRQITNKTQLAALPHFSRHDPHNVSQSGRGVLDCGTLKLSHGFERWPVTPQERQFPLAFSFKIHKKPDMFVRLLSVVWRPHNFYCVHVDGKSSGGIFEQMEQVSRCFPNVALTESRVKVGHGSISSLYADLECVKMAVASSIPWKYHINLCGQDFPLKTNLEMVQILTAMNGTNDVENYPPSEQFFRLSYKYERVIEHGVKTKRLKAPFPVTSLQIRKGSAYNCLHRSFLEWSLKDQINQQLLGWLNSTWAPDELFWASLSYRREAPGGPRALVRHSDDAMLSKAVVWAWDPYRCHGNYVRGVCIFSTLDLPWLLSRHELAANKFDQDQDSTVLDCLEAELEGRAVRGYREWVHASSHLHLSPGQWPRLSNLNWTLYNSLPQFSRNKKLG